MGWQCDSKWVICIECEKTESRSHRTRSGQKCPSWLAWRWSDWCVWWCLDIDGHVLYTVDIGFYLSHFLMLSWLIRIAAYGLALWGVSSYLPQLWFSITAGEGTSYGLALVVVTVAFWIMDHVVKKILKIVTVPLNILTLGLAWFVVNVFLFYVLQVLLESIPGVNVGIELWSFVQVALLSIVLSFAGSFISFLL